MNLENSNAWTTAELYKIAQEQKNLLNIVFCSIIASMGVNASVSKHNTIAIIFFMLLRLSMLIAAIYYSGVLAGALRRTPYKYIVALFIPILGLLAILRLMNYATKALQSSGIQVGLMGPSKAKIEELKAQKDQLPVS